MKELFESWREFYKSNSSKNKLNEGWTEDDARAEKAAEKRAREIAAQKSAEAAAASPEGIKKAKHNAVYKKLEPVAMAMQKSEWDRDYLTRLPNMIAYEFSARQDLPSPSEPGFEEILTKLLNSAEPIMRSQFAKWDSEGRERFKADPVRADSWWQSEGHKEYVVDPAKEIVSQL